MFATVNSRTHKTLRRHVFCQLASFGKIAVFQTLMSIYESSYSAKQRIQFIDHCRDEQVLPSSLHYLAKMNSRGEAWPLLWDAALADVKHGLIEEKNSKWRRLQQVKNDFHLATLFLPRDLVRDCLRVAKENAVYKRQLQSAKQDSRLKRLCEQSCWAKAPILASVKNLSSYVLTQSELELLGLGLAFSCPPKADAVIDVLDSLNNLQSYASGIVSELQTLKGLAINGLKDLMKSKAGLPKRFRLAKQSLQRKRDIIILKSDKGNSTVIIDKAEYVRAGEDMLADTNVYNRLNKNPMEGEQKAFNKKLKNIFKSMSLPTPAKFLAYLPTLPHVYFSPKLHKTPMSYRPIVSQKKSYSKPLTKHLTVHLTKSLGTFSDAHLLDSTHLKSTLCEKADPTCPFISLDVESLFTNVPIKPLLDFLYRKHEQGGLPLPIGYTIDGFLALIDLCVSSTIFSFNGKYYRQRQGVAMGSALGPVLACLYMEYMETELLLSLPGPTPSFWVRYIDDVLIQWKHTMEEFHIFLDKLNNLESLINFTTEM